MAATESPPPTEFQARLTERKEQRLAEIMRRLRPWDRTRKPGCATMRTPDQRGLVLVAGTAPRVKIHLILDGYAICATRRREGERQALTTIGVFKLLLDDERCERCAAKLRRIEDPRWNAMVEP